MRSVSIMALALTLGACSSTAMEAVDDPSATVSFQENGLTVGPAVYFCHKWSKGGVRVSADIAVPDGDPVVLDFFFTFDAGTEGFGPDVDDLEKLEAAGATIMHRFNVTAARAEVPRDSLSRVTGPSVNHVRTVPAADRFDVWMTVGYLHEAEEEIQQRALELGGHIESTLPGHPGGVPSFKGVLPDTAIKQLRQEFSEELVWAEQENIGCLAGA